MSELLIRARPRIILATASTSCRYAREFITSAHFSAQKLSWGRAAVRDRWLPTGLPVPEHCCRWPDRHFPGANLWPPNDAGQSRSPCFRCYLAARFLGSEGKSDSCFGKPRGMLGVKELDLRFRPGSASGLAATGNATCSWECPFASFPEAGRGKSPADPRAGCEGSDFESWNPF